MGDGGALIHDTDGKKSPWNLKNRSSMQFLNHFQTVFKTIFVFKIKWFNFNGEESVRKKSLLDKPPPGQTPPGQKPYMSIKT